MEKINKLQNFLSNFPEALFLTKAEDILFFM